MGLTQKDYDNINEREASQNLAQLINNWLERMPFFEEQFWKNYKHSSNDKNNKSMFSGTITGMYIIPV